jgi:hypothetical protein
MSVDIADLGVGADAVSGVAAAVSIHDQSVIPTKLYGVVYGVAEYNEMSSVSPSVNGKGSDLVSIWTSDALAVTLKKSGTIGVVMP